MAGTEEKNSHGKKKMGSENQVNDRAPGMKADPFRTLASTRSALRNTISARQFWPTCTVFVQDERVRSFDKENARLRRSSRPHNRLKKPKNGMMKRRTAVPWTATRIS
jgi:hypothetical protein